VPPTVVVGNIDELVGNDEGRGRVTHKSQAAAGCESRDHDEQIGIDAVNAIAGCSRRALPRNRLRSIPSGNATNSTSVLVGISAS